MNKNTNPNLRSQNWKPKTTDCTKITATTTKSLSTSTKTSAKLHRLHNFSNPLKFFTRIQPSSKSNSRNPLNTIQWETHKFITKKTKKEKKRGTQIQTKPIIQKQLKIIPQIHNNIKLYQTQKPRSNTTPHKAKRTQTIQQKHRK